MISSIVLAAGEAKRFGQLKQLVLLGEKTMLEQVLDTVNRSRADDIIVVLGAHSDEIRSRIPFIRERIVVNDQYAQGMSGSLQAGLRALRAEADGAVIVLADQPFVTTATIDTLIDEFNRKRPGAAVPTFNGVRGNPVLLGRSLFDEVMGLRGDTGFRAVFADHAESILRVPVDDRGILSDIDTMEDFDRARGEL